MVRIEQSELAVAAKVSVDTIKRLERTIGPVSANVATVNAVVQVLEAAGMEFTNGGQPGVRLKATRIAIPKEVFVAGLQKLEPFLRSNAQFEGLRLTYDSETSVRLSRFGQVIGKASQHNGMGFFDPGVAHEGAQEALANVEYIFQDWAGAALRRSNRSVD
jgi:hypothetical protein